MTSIQTEPIEGRSSFQNLSPELQQNIFQYVGVSGALSCIDVCRQWRKLLSDSLFLDSVCRRRFGLPLSSLPEPSPSEELLINTQRLAFYEGERIVSTVDNADKAWMKIYAMEIRTTWWPCPVGGERAKIEYPWPYDINIRRPVEWGDKHFAARIHAAVPGLFSAFLNGGADVEFDYTRPYYSCRGRPLTTSGSILRRIDEMCPQFDLGVADGRATWALEAVAASSKLALSIIVYPDHTWKTVSYNVDGAYSVAVFRVVIAAGPVNMNDVRESAGPVFDIFIMQAVTPSQEIPIPFDRHRRYEKVIDRPIPGFENKFKPAQEILLKLLDQRIREASEAMNKKFVEKFGVKGEVAENLVQKCIEFLNAQAPCTTGHHHGCDREYTSNGNGGELSRWKLEKNRFWTAAKRAIRRSVNEMYLKEARDWYNKAFRMMHSWSFKKTTSGARCCPPVKALTCRTKKALKDMCNHEAEPSLWPLPVLRAAADSVPKIQQRLQVELEAFTRRYEF